jgi:hypothetical protein
MEKIVEFGRHPSEKLQQIFSQRPFQIQEPEKAKIIFLGLDANLDKNIEKNENFFNDLLEYLNDGVKYWKSNGYHTPMLKSTYNGDGKVYHERFCKLGFSSKNADDVCFIELLKYCTYGKSTGKNKKLFMEMLLNNENKYHVERIKRLVEMENLICIPKGVKPIIDELQLFDTNSKKIIVHTHFSNAISNKELYELGKKLQEYIK